MATSTCFLSVGISAISRRNLTVTSSSSVNNRPTRRFALSTAVGEVSITTTTTENTTPFPTNRQEEGADDNKYNSVAAPPSASHVYTEESPKKSLRDYFQEAMVLVKHRASGSDDDDVPRWFSPVECGPPSDNSPLLLYLPGIDGVGLGLIRQHHRLRKIFDVWCLHIPVKSRTPFQELVDIVEKTVRSENVRAPKRPIYLVGDSLGGCLALQVAARNPDIDILLILSNPTTSFGKSLLQTLIPILEVMPDKFQLPLPYILNLLSGDPSRKVTIDVVKGLILQQIFGLSPDLIAIPSILADVADILPKETLLWKLKLLRSASQQVNSYLHAVKAPTLIFSSGSDQLLPSEKEAKRLHSILPDCEIRNFAGSGHFLFLEDGIDMLTVIKASCFYRRGKQRDSITDFLPPTPSEFKKLYESNRWLITLMNPVMLSTLEDGKVVKGLAGLPSEGPVLYVGYHMLVGLELTPMISQALTERNILMRGLSHPMVFSKTKSGLLPDRPHFDSFRIMGAVPLSAFNFYRLLNLKSHVLLYPGGAREAFHRKGEEYKLFWPEQSEFIRMAARFGAKIVPFGVVGEDDITNLIYDYDDQMKNPYFRDQIDELRKETVNLRSPEDGEVANQDLHMPWITPKLPGRFYYYFGKPIQTAGMKEELKDKEKVQELYIHVKSEVERLIAYLKKKREEDPYRSIVARVPYQARNGFTSDVPTFDF
ncbi:phytyl ester synthase 2, chloroplastic-like [Rutidosis leptorrhynchoides]|uniref:phytyl ester synthase 2, chloroplastic-like n=1 Tax=Rutidosis leptorrhynchoides TaxID=125765 RepID=UPI003A9A5B75